MAGKPYATAFCINGLILLSLLLLMIHVGDDDIVLVRLLLIMVTEYDPYLGGAAPGAWCLQPWHYDDIVLVRLLLIMVTEYDLYLGGAAPRSWCLLPWRALFFIYTVFDVPVHVGLRAIIQRLAASQTLNPFTIYYTFGLEALQTLYPVVEDDGKRIKYHSRMFRAMSLRHAMSRRHIVIVPLSLSDKGRTELCSVLKKNLDIFAWQPSDMIGVPRSVAEHRLNIREGYTPVRQKKREVQKLVDVGIMREVYYHDWLSNPVMVKKHDGSWRMCVDFTDLNRACPQDCYPMPKIDWKVESLCGYPFKCFLDAYKGYHQIQLTEADEENTAFHTGQGVYCYTKMPFGLKNAGATYQRLMNKAFESQMGRNIEVYVDDLVVKSRTEAEMVRDIEETLRTLRKINMKLNPKKCSFGLAEGVFLGYVITPEGIKPCPDKTAAVLQLPSPQTVKEVQSLNGKLASLNRFLSKSAEKSLPLFQTLKKCIKKSDFRWTAEAEQVFQQLKQHLSELPLLVAPNPQEELIMYLSATHGAASAVLMTERGTTQMPIYFISRALQGPELSYSPMEKLFLSLVFAAKRFRRPRTSVKGQILADFLTEMPEGVPRADPTEVAQEEPWTLFTDGSSCVDGSGAGLILTNPEGVEFTYALLFQFTASNNEAEYEALVVGLRIATQMGVKNIQDYRAFENGHDIFALARPFWRMELIKYMPLVATQQQPPSLFAYYSLAEQRTDYPDDSVIPLYPYVNFE
nr:reverse transcriptase domain-containing protein [Tanacetum cinerariifolium]